MAKLIITMVSEGEEKSTSTSASDTEMDDDKATAKYTTRHGSHLTKLPRVLLNLKMLRAKNLNFNN